MDLSLQPAAAFSLAILAEGHVSSAAFPAAAEFLERVIDPPSTGVEGGFGQGHLLRRLPGVLNSLLSGGRHARTAGPGSAARIIAGRVRAHVSTRAASWRLATGAAGTPAPDLPATVLACHLHACA